MTDNDPQGWRVVKPSHCELSHFSPFIYKQLVPLVRATPLTVLYRLLWNFACIFFMVWRCACALDIIVRSFFFTFFHIVNLVIVSTTPHTILYQSFWNFAHVFSIVWRCAYAFHIILALIFVTFFYFLNFVIFWPQIYRQWVFCVCNFSYSFKLVFLKFCFECFLQGLQKCTWFLNLFLSIFPL